MSSATNKRVSILDTPRSGSFKRNIIDGVPHCVDCNCVIDEYMPGQGGKPMRCSKCVKLRKSTVGIQQAAHTIVSCAVRSGIIKPPSQFSCVDCGLPASVYDHRNYYKPLDVQPVCRSCNVIRGPAINLKAA